MGRCLTEHGRSNCQAVEEDRVPENKRGRLIARRGISLPWDLS
jgi:hypothetical protein